MKNKFLLATIVCLIITLNLTAQESGTFTDSRDGKTYKTVKIGSQVWMAENLNYNTGSGSWCYNDDSSNCAKYGKLYDWETANDVCPSGWHLPSLAEFETLLQNCGGEGASSYSVLIENGNSGFSALFGGFRVGRSIFLYMGDIGYFFSSSESDDEYAWNLNINSNSKKTYMSTINKSVGFSVRCVKD